MRSADHQLRFPPCAIAVVALALLCGCGSPASRPGGGEIEPPTRWINALEENEGRVLPGWLGAFGDAQLEQIVAEALEHNYDLRAAASRLAVVREGIITARSLRLPSIGASLSGSHSETRFEEPDGGLSSFVDAEGTTLAASASWEVDLWGRLANLHRAAIEDYDAQIEDFRGARLSLAANVASTWYNLVAARQQVELARQTRSSFERNYRITERNYKAGDPTTSSLSVNFSRNQVASAERGLISRELALNETRRTLEVLLGRYPEGAVAGRDSLPQLSGSVPVGLPSELLLRRPDLAAAAADVRASAERASAARKALLPSINLTAGGSSTKSSLELLDLLRDPTSIAWSVAASVSQPVFRGGALRAQARQAGARNDAQLAVFSSVALRAFREVESALATEHSLAAQERSLQVELEQANLAEAQAYRDYSQGIVEILSVLEAQRRAFNARSAMISLRNDRVQTRIGLHLALGGDFEVAPGDRLDAGDVAATDTAATATIGRAVAGLVGARAKR